MLMMLLKMTMVTTLYVLLTVLIWKRTQKFSLTWGHKLLIGLIYGACAVLSTHFGVDFQHMLLNVRDLGPLSAGLFFDPLSGILAGLIGGIERYIAGTYWGVGSYTRIACSVSTCLAGFVSAGLHIFIFKRKKPSATYAFFMGAVMEVFHMYVVFITHRADMDMAFYVVKTCSPAMIAFTGLGMAASSTALQISSGEWKIPFRKVNPEEISVSQRFQFWLFAVTSFIMLLNVAFSFVIQTQTAVQQAEQTLATVSGGIRETYVRLQQTENNTDVLAGETARMDAQAIATHLERSGGLASTDDAFLEQLRSIFDLVSVIAVDKNGDAIASSGKTQVYPELLSQLNEGIEVAETADPAGVRVAAGARCGDGMIQVVINKHSLTSALNLSGLSEALSYFHVGSDGTFDIIEQSGAVTAGDHRGAELSAQTLSILGKQDVGTCFRATLFQSESLCLTEQLDDDLTLLVRLPMTEVYENRDTQAFETAFSVIILFAVIYVLISMLVQGIVVNNLQMVNESLERITDGDLNEVVSVRKSKEFVSLSDDINQTVSVLKGYIDAAEKRMEQELEFARTIQDSSLPKNFFSHHSEFELYATMDPAKEVGGDFYDFFFVGQKKLALVIADVSGKGIPAALFMMRAKTTIRGLAESGKTPSDILYLANNTLCEGNDADMFVTVWVGIIDLATGQMKCANAGHEFPILMRAGGDYTVFQDKHGLVLAGMEEMRYKEYELKLDPGDRLFIYTDGIPEAINESVEQYGVDRLVGILNQLKTGTMRETLLGVRENIAQFVGEADQFDDITMLGFTYRGVQEDRA